SHNSRQGNSALSEARRPMASGSCSLFRNAGDRGAPGLLRRGTFLFWEALCGKGGRQRTPTKEADWPRETRALILLVRVGHVFSSSVPRVILDEAVFLARLNFRNSQSFQGAVGPDPARAAKKNEQRQSDTTSPRHGHSARGPTFHRFQHRAPHARQQARLDANAHEESENRSDYRST